MDEILKRSNLQQDTLDRKNFEDEWSAPSIEERLMYKGVTDPSHTFENIKMIKGLETTVKAFKEIVTPGSSFSMLMVYGIPGNGKTLCCEAAVISLHKRGIYVNRNRWSDIVRKMKSLFNGQGEMPYKEYFDRLQRAPRLILDDVGSGSTLGPWEWGELEDIIDYRYERNMFTILTTNLDIKLFPDRILSRFRDKRRARLVVNDAPDHRPLNTKDTGEYSLRK